MAKAYFSKEAHRYFIDIEDYKKFKKSYDKNPEWAVRNIKRWNPINSTTSIIGEVFPFSGGLKITTAWFDKVYRKDIFNAKEEIESKHLSDTLLDVLSTLHFVDNILSDNVKETQVRGTEAHGIAHYWAQLPTKKDRDVFKKGVNKNTYEWVLIEQLEVILGNEYKYIPSEEPRYIFMNVDGKEFVYSGMWDLFVEKDGEFISIDLKTGSQVYFDKKKKVEIQLGAYSFIQEEDFLKPTKLVCVSAYEKENKETGEWKVEGEIILFDTDTARHKWQTTLNIWSLLKELK